MIAIRSFAVSLILLSACTTDSGLRKVHFLPLGNDHDLPEHLMRRGVHVSRHTDGSVAFYYSQATRDALLSYLSLVQTRIDVINNNIANIDTMRSPDDGGGTFLRRRILTDDSGSIVAVEAIPRTGNPKFIVFDPKHPDGDDEGYVRYPEIDLYAETEELRTATKAYESARRILAPADRRLIDAENSIAYRTSYAE